MAETALDVMLIGQTQMSPKFYKMLAEEIEDILLTNLVDKDTQAIALTAIRTCYSSDSPMEILINEADKYFKQAASDGEDGLEADRLIRHIMRSKHTSTIEHLNYTFAIKGLSRSALAQFTRHRFFSFSVQSQRYVKFGSGDKSGGFDYVMPPSIANNDNEREIGWPDSGYGLRQTAQEFFDLVMRDLQMAYDILRNDFKVPAEDCRFVLPNAAATNLVTTANLRAILEFYSKRKPGRGAQWEIAEVAERIRQEIEKVDPWTSRFFDEV